MTVMVTIEVPVELRDRIVNLASRQHITMVEVLRRAIETAETEAFWSEVRATMGTPEARADLQRETDLLEGTLRDGLEPEDWSEYE
ncbi:hypothetical protein [Glycomyces rhizosphaerae]|uniref:Ribbon-helix-helix protein, CopG family n=1 Tax=Glycomyces rhizosphaerae TaxID=2054422 RepID=A0ABV7Q8R5_9ACTN